MDTRRCLTPINYHYVTGITKVSNSESSIQTHFVIWNRATRSFIMYRQSSIVTVSLSCSVSEISSFKYVLWLWLRPVEGQFVISMQIYHTANHCTKFKVSSLGYLRGTKTLNESCDIISNQPLLERYHWCFILLIKLDIAWQKTTTTYTALYTYSAVKIYEFREA